MSGPDNLRICLVALDGFGAFSDFRTGHVGGIERQAAIVAREMARRGIPVTVITRDEGQEDEMMIDGVRMLKAYSNDAGIPGLRFFHPRWSLVTAALRKADCDIYYQMGADTITGQIAAWCRRNNRYFVFAGASDGDFDPRLPTMPRLYQRCFYRFGLRTCDLVITQTRTQQQALERHFGVSKSRVVPNPCAPQIQAMSPGETPEASSRRVLWVARISPVKRLEWLVEIAQLAPDLHFDVVGPVGDESYAEPILERISRMGNITLHGKISDETLRKLYARCVALCCTSTTEGVPNTFLEAWSFGRPVVSTIDVDGVIAQGGLGAIAGSPAELAAELRAFASSREKQLLAAEKAIKYFRVNHSVESAVGRLLDTLRHVARSVPNKELKDTVSTAA